MALDYLKHIGTKIKEQNTFIEYFGVNAIQLPNGKVIKYTDDKEKIFTGISDCVGVGFYIRFNQEASFTEDRKITSSITQTFKKQVCKLVLYSFDERKKLDSRKVLNKLENDLKNINWYGFQGARGVVTLKKSNLSYFDNFTTEAKKKLNLEDEFLCVSVEFELKYLLTNASCETCDVYYVPCENGN